MTKIVQCPSCNTKFALNESQLSGVESPKFQCSRCQTIFNLNVDVPEEIEEVKVIPPTSEPLSGKWDLGAAVTLDEDKTTETADPYLKDFAIDIGKFSMGTSLGTSTKLTQDDSMQLDFGFNKPKISHNTQPPLQENPVEKKVPEQSLRDSPTRINNRLDIETLDNMIYGESGKKDSSISVDWESDENKDEEEELVSDFVKPAEIKRQPTSEQKNDPNSDDLSSIFRSGSQRSSTGTHAKTFIQESELATPENIATSSSPSWSELKEKMEKQDEEDIESAYAIVPIKHDSYESKSSDLSSIDLLNFPFQDPAESSDPSNRSIKHTTIVKRDSLDVEGFLSPSDHSEEDHVEAPFSRAKAFNFRSINLKSIGLKSALQGFIKFAQNLNIRPNDLEPFTKSLIAAWSIPVIFIVLLFIWGHTLESKENLNPVESSFADAVALFTPPEFLLPPPELVVNNLVADLRPDKLGEPMIVISGNILNAGKRDVLRAVMEARTYDKENNLVKTIQAPAPNELSRFASSVNFTEISKDELLALQNQRSWEGVSANKSIPFKMVITDIGQGYHNFSAKIYSVGEII